MRPIRDGRLTSDKLAELMVGPDDAAVCVAGYYSGYNGDREAMRADWQTWRDEIKAFWDSGAYSTPANVNAHGIPVKVLPPVFVRGCGGPCWAESQFDDGHK